MPKENNSRDKFVKLAESRTQSALSVIRKIGNLSNKRAYDYSDTDVKKIVKALRDAVSEMERRFSTTGEQADNFKL